ncbi:MAG TPA: ParB/RepB/Spo0J family partition protein [Pseudomonadales bacterium]|nr:ParB/RepB/Spo0J family partition protein [Pseudomonadales bacterium]
MATRKRGLGRGLDALLGAGKPAEPRAAVPVAADDTAEDGAHDAAVASAPDTPSVPGAERLVRLPVEQLRRGRYQPRREMDPDRLEELAASIRSQGVMQPIVARPLAEADSYEIIAGERRWRAAQLAGLDRVPVIVREIPDEAAIALALIENIQREDLNPVEEAVALQRLIDEFGLTQQAVAETVGKSRSTIANLLRLLKLGGEVRELLETGAIEMGHARALLTLEPLDQLRIARAVVAKGLSVRQTEALARKASETGDGEGQADAGTPDTDTAHLERRLSEKVGAPVTIQQGARGTGRLVIRYSSLDELDGILAHIR